MGKLLTAIFYILMIIEYATFYYTVFRKKEWRDYKRSANGRLFLAGILLCGIVCMGGFMEWYSGNELLPIMGGTLLAMYLLFQVPFSDNFRMWLVSYSVISSLELTGNLILRIFLPENEIGRSIIYTAVIIILLWIYYALLGRKVDEKAFQIPGKIWWMIAGMFVLLLFMLAFFNALILEIVEQWNGSGYYEIYTVGGLFIFFIVLFFSVLLFSMVYYLNYTRQFHMETEMLEEFNEQQKEYFVGLLNREQETKKFRHDIKNELLQLKFYCEEENYGQLSRYLCEMLGEMETIHGKNYNVGNDIINTVINYYFQNIENTTVQVTGYLGKEILVSQRDLCILTSNLVKNAVEAVMPLDTDKQIRIQVSQGRQYIGFHIENSIEDAAYAKDGRPPVTTKRDKKNHGIGLQNVQSVVKKYEGRYQQEIRGSMYVVDVQLKNMTVYGEK